MLECDEKPLTYTEKLLVKYHKYIDEYTNKKNEHNRTFSNNTLFNDRNNKLAFKKK